MEYIDEQILNIEDYEIMAKAYANELKKRGFMVVRVDNEETSALANEIFQLLLKIKSHLLMLGGFLNTSKLYSLNERQIKKFSLLYDVSPSTQNFKPYRDKTKSFLALLSEEFKLIKQLILLAGKSNYENEIFKMIDSRLTLFSQILSV